MAEDSDEVRALKEKIALLEQQKQLLEVERLRLEAEKNLRMAQEGPSAAAQEAARLKEQVALLTEQRNLITAAMPTLPTGLQGTIAVNDNQSIEAHAAAYRTMREVADELVKTLATAVPPKAEVVLLTLDDRNALATAQLFTADVALLMKAYGRHAPHLESVGGVLLGAGAIAKTASDVMALFREDTQHLARTVAVPDEALVVEMASRLGERGVYYPAGFPVYAASTTDEVVVLLQPLEKARADALTRHRERTRGLAAATGAEKASATARKAAFDEDWKALETAYTKLMEALRARDSGTGTTPLAQISRGTWLQKRLQRKDPPTYALSLKVLHSGGTYVLRKSFWKGTRMRQSGGIVVEYLLFDGTGQLKKSGTLDRTKEFPDLALK